MIVLQDEVNEKVVSLCIRGGKISAQILKASLQKLLREMEQSQKRQKISGKGQKKETVYHGKQSMEKLKAHNQELSNIEVTDGNIRSFEKYARKYDIDYCLKKDRSAEPPKYYVFFKAKEVDSITAAFKEYTGWQLKKSEGLIKRVHVENVDEELRRLDKAKEKTLQQLARLYDKALKEVGKVNAEIFEVHQIMLEDEDYQDAIHNMICNENVNAEYAVSITGDNFADMFANMDDDYMRARSADVKDISNRLVSNLSGEEQPDWENTEPSIIVADDLTPSETVQMDKNKILAFVLVHGSANSHTAILARMMNIPALIGVPIELESLPNGVNAIVDGQNGIFYLNPDENQIAQAKEAQQKEQEQKKLLANYKGRESVTKSGRKINLYANIGNVSDVAYVLENDAEGIGLFRSEFLYLGRDELPDETEQFNAYRQVLQMMADKKVVIRTLDIGADKKADYLGLGKEDNPALGYRAIRICLEQPDIFKTQLRALLRAAKYGNLSIMYPMIISVEEVVSIKKIVAEVAEELENENIPYEIPEQGIMIETPAAVMLSEELAELVDFFSIGTNDLTQYTLAIDRQNNRLDRFYNPHHEAVLRMIEMTVQGAHKHGKWVGICGELGADTTLTERFIKMGIDELSVSPSMVLGVRSRICEME